MFDFAGYFENIARKLKAIGHTDSQKHFFRSTQAVHPEELLKQGSVARYPALVIIERADGRMIDRDSDNLLTKELYAFQILMPAADQAPDAIETVMGQCKEIYKKIVAKMIRDKKADMKVAITMQQTGLRNLETADISYQQIGPMGDNLYGLYVSFSIVDPAGVKFNQDDWIE